MAMEIAQAVAAAKEGDKQAFYHLYQQFVGRVYAICWRLLGNKQKAEDASQEIFIKVWQQLPAFRGDSSFKTWLFGIANYRAMDILRKRKHSDNDDALAELPDDAPELSQQLAGAQQQQQHRIGRSRPLIRALIAGAPPSGLQQCDNGRHA